MLLVKEHFGHCFLSNSILNMKKENLRKVKKKNPTAYKDLNAKNQKNQACKQL